MTIHDLPKKLQEQGVVMYKQGDDVPIKMSEEQTLRALVIFDNEIPAKKETA